MEKELFGKLDTTDKKDIDLLEKLMQNLRKWKMKQNPKE